MKAGEARRRETVMIRKVFVCLLCTLPIGQNLRGAGDGANTMTPQDLLDKWEQALSGSQSCAMECELVMMEYYSWKPKVTWRRITETCYRENNGKLNMTYQTAYDLPTPDAPTIPEKVQYSQLLWDGKQLYSFNGRANPSSSLLIFHPVSDHAQI